MIRVKMRHDEPRQLPALKRPRDERFPDILRHLVRDPCVQNGPAIAIVDEEDVDVVQAERQRNAKPQNAGSDFGKLAGRWRLREWKAKLFRRQILDHALA